ncbi:MAG: hypothetical protein Q3M30_04645 [Candidatus Electrothrix sp. Rat3]|nr:hypothetical protein [Candidatus Electrothrix rattekaaiensis]
MNIPSSLSQKADPDDLKAILGHQSVTATTHRNPLFRQLISISVA